MPASPFGPYRSLYISLQNQLEFLALSSDARLLFYTIKFSPLGTVAGVFVYHDAVGLLHTGLPPGRYRAALKELCDSVPHPWIITEGSVVWLRNGLKFEPGYALTDPNKKKGIEKLLVTLPKLQIIRNFSYYYTCEAPPGLPQGTPEAPPGGPHDPPPHKETDTETETDTSIFHI